VEKHCHKKKRFKRFKYTFANPTSSNLNQTDISSIISKKKPKLEAHPPSSLLATLVFVFQFCDIASMVSYLTKLAKLGRKQNMKIKTFM
jgi:hypothetical protein